MTDDQLVERFVNLARDLDSLLKEAGPILEKMGTIRGAMAVIKDEIDKRNV